MKLKLLVIIFFLIFINVASIRAMQLNKEVDMKQIIEIDNVFSNNKAINTSNPRVIEVEQSNYIYLHFVTHCNITSVNYKDLVRGRTRTLAG